MKPETAELLGRQVGNIRVVDVLGEGGMGAVYSGFDDKLQRKVAIKAIHTEFRLQDEAKARFLREARILSQLDHPNICTVHDLIEIEDRDFLVLELIKGRSLRQAMDDGLDEAEKMHIARLLLEVLVAVHGRGVMHRDLKPDNVMVLKEGGIKVLDFGLSRSIDEAGERGSKVLTLHMAVPSGDTGFPETMRRAGDSRSTYVKTQRGIVLGTVGYMSPEQARAEPATSASDMYSLGMMLQELFTGEPPFEPGLESAVLLQRASEGRSRPVTGLRKDLTEFIDRLKALAPGARPSSVDALAAFERILDRPRRRLKAMAVAVLVAVLVAFAATTTTLLVKVSREAERANLEAETANQVSKFLTGIFKVSDPAKNLGSTVTARDLLDRAAERIPEELGDKPLLRARMMDTIGFIYLRMGLYDPSMPLLEGALQLRREHHDGEHPEIVESLDVLSTLRYSMGEYDEAERLSREAVEIDRKIHGDNHPILANRLHNLAVMVHARGDLEASEELWREVLEIRIKDLGENHQNTAMSYAGLANLLTQKGEYDSAEPLLRKAIESYQAFFGDEHPRVAAAMNFLGNTLSAKGDMEQAEQVYVDALAMRRRMHPDGHPDIATSLNNLAVHYKKMKRYDQAETLFLEALAMDHRMRGDRHPSVAARSYNLARMYMEQGRSDLALPLFRDAVDIAEDTLPVSHPNRQKFASRYAEALREVGRDTEAAEVEASITPAPPPNP